MGKSRSHKAATTLKEIADQVGANTKLRHREKATYHYGLAKHYRVMAERAPNTIHERHYTNKADVHESLGNYHDNATKLSAYQTDGSSHHTRHILNNRRQGAYGWYGYGLMPYQARGKIFADSPYIENRIASHRLTNM